MFFSRRIVWRNPSGSIGLTRQVFNQCNDLLDAWRHQWYEQWPDVDSDPKWYLRPNPEAARGYPPGFLKNNLDAFIIYTASSPEVDGFFWAREKFVTGVDSYEALEAVLEQMPEPVEMLAISGERLNLPGDACGVCWREHNEVGFSSAMPGSTAALLRSRIRESGYLLVASCHAGDNPDLVQEMANVVSRPVAGACGVSRGIRAELLEDDGAFWTLGAHADDRAYTLREPVVATKKVRPRAKSSGRAVTPRKRASRPKRKGRTSTE
ncbi:MAG: hypothetical protein U0840_10630 [Gemmataceae bacterium]